MFVRERTSSLALLSIDEKEEQRVPAARTLLSPYFRGLLAGRAYSCILECLRYLFSVDVKDVTLCTP